MVIREVFLLFKARVEELRNTRLIKQGFNPGFTLKAEAMKALHWESRQPDEEDLRSFLITFRQFLSPNEPIHLNRIYNLCHQHLSSNELKECLIKSREVWKKQLEKGGIRLGFRNGKFTPEYVTDLWINGFYFHNDANKMNELKSLLFHERFFVRHQFLNHLVEATRQVFYLDNIITVALKEDSFKNL